MKSNKANPEGSSNLDSGNITERFRGLSVHNTGATARDNTSVHSVYQRPLVSYAETYNEVSDHFQTDCSKTNKQVINLERLLKSSKRQLSELKDDLRYLQDIDNGYKINYEEAKNEFDKFRQDQQAFLNNCDYITAYSQELVLTDTSFKHHSIIAQVQQNEKDAYDFYAENKMKLHKLQKVLKFHYRIQFG